MSSSHGFLDTFAKTVSGDEAVRSSIEKALYNYTMMLREQIVMFIDTHMEIGDVSILPGNTGEVPIVKREIISQRIID